MIHQEMVMIDGAVAEYRRDRAVQLYDQEL
jgi:hypothetical protein